MGLEEEKGTDGSEQAGPDHYGIPSICMQPTWEICSLGLAQSDDMQKGNWSLDMNRMLQGTLCHSLQVRSRMLQKCYSNSSLFLIENTPHLIDFLHLQVTGTIGS